MKLQSSTPIFYAIGSVISFVTMQIFVKKLTQQITAQYILQVRSIILFAINAIFILCSSDYEPYQKQKQIVSVSPDKHYFSFNIKSKPVLLLMIKRQLWTAASLNIYLSSLKFMHISIANALLNTAPIISYFAQAFFYKKSFREMNKIFMLLTIISFAGVFIILNPFGHIQGYDFNLYLLMPLAAAVATCFNYLYLYEMRNSCKELIVLQYAYTFQLLTSSVITTFVGSTSAHSNDANFINYSYLQMAGLIIIIVVLAYCAQWMRVKSIFMKKPSQILVFSYSGVLYSILVDVIIFKSNIQWLTIVGVLLTSAGLMSQFLISIFHKQK